ncbi:MAG: ATP phosphoribosyltransferase [Leptospiraceae bacterium]|nr:MAG: ATP phosphoribosyltransferase [Leptospiraceae bacterium]
MQNEILTIALPSGRMSEEAINFLNETKIVNVQLPNTRELTFYDSDKKIRFLLVRNQDIPLTVIHGGANAGICGKDILYENGYDLTYPVSLPFGYCRLSLAISSDLDEKQFFKKSHIRVATKYPNLTKDYFFKKGINAEIIKLHGSIELGPILGIADCIVDLVSTGRTLKENNLKEVEVILESTATLIVNKASYYIFHKQIRELIQILKHKINKN